jgi:hypothetical protein
MIYSSTEDRATVDGFPTFKVDEEIFGVKLGPDGMPLRWLSHRNKKYHTEPTPYAGPAFGPDHELWSHVSPGDRLAVIGCCQFPAWSCIGKDAHLTTWLYYDPESSFKEGNESRQRRVG